MYKLYLVSIHSHFLTVCYCLLFITIDTVQCTSVQGKQIFVRHFSNCIILYFYKFTKFQTPVPARTLKLSSILGPRVIQELDVDAVATNALKSHKLRNGASILCFWGQTHYCISVYLLVVYINTLCRMVLGYHTFLSSYS